MCLEVYAYIEIERIYTIYIEGWPFIVYISNKGIVSVSVHADVCVRVRGACPPPGRKEGGGAI